MLSVTDIDVDNDLPYTDEEQMRGDCALIVRLRPIHSQAFDPNNGVEENKDTVANILKRLGATISYRQHTKVLTITTETIKYICQHPFLPIIIIRLLNISCDNNMEPINAIDLLYDLTLTNRAVSELDRQLIRWHFVDPINYKVLADILQHRPNVIRENDTMVDFKLKVLKTLDCVSIQKGSQNQTCLVNKENINSLKEILSSNQNNEEMTNYVLRLVKILCRNKINCHLFCCDHFLNTFMAAVQLTKTFALSVTILNFLSKDGESIQIMAKSEPLFNFIVNSLLWEKFTNKTHVISTLYKMTLNSKYVSQYCYWSKLLHYFRQFGNQCENQKSNLLAVKVFTILNRGVTSSNEMEISPPCIDVQMPDLFNPLQVITYQNDSDNDFDEKEDENSNISDYANDSDIESDTHDDCDKTKQCSILKQQLRTRLEDLYAEFSSESVYNVRTNSLIPKNELFMLDVDQRNKIISQKTEINAKINYRAYPDSIIKTVDQNQDFVSEQSNKIEIKTLARKVKRAKDNNAKSTLFESREIYNLDFLMSNAASDCPNSPRSNTYERPETGQEVKFDYTFSSRHVSKDFLQFESRFESGNLRRVEQVGEFEYNLFLTPDVHLTNGLQWFYFQVTNMNADQSYTFNLINFVKVNSQFNYGLQPVVFSVGNFAINSVGWKKCGHNIIYHGNEFVDKRTAKQLRTLSFTLEFPYNDDCCYIAYHYPYTYTKLMMNIASLLSSQTTIIYKRCDKLCSTINNKNDVPLISITSSICREKVAAIPFHKRPLVFLTARVHPCESNASWIMDGLLEFLLNENDELAIQARDHFIFKIIPMLNVEGVIYGNSRCGLSGDDLNRCWKRPSQILHPEIFYTKELVRYARDILKKPIVTFVDIHGHSRKKYFFLYGCNPLLSWNDKDRESKRNNSDSLPKAVAAVNNSMKLSFCRFNIEKKRESTCRVVMWREFGIDLSYTLECSYCSGVNKQKMTVAMLQDIGKSVIIALLDLQV